METLVQKLLDNALDSGIKVSDLLRQAIHVARTLDLDEAVTKFRRELEGYEDADNVPSVRWVTGEVRILTRSGVWTPVLFPEKRNQELFCRRPAFQAVGDLEHLLATGSDEMQLPFPPDAETLFFEELGTQGRATLVVQSVYFHSIVEHARNVVLDWASTLKKNGVAGEGHEFEPTELKAAANAPTITNVTFNGSISGSNIQQFSPNSTQAITLSPIDQERLFAALVELDPFITELPQEAADEAKAQQATITAQSQSPKPDPTIIRSALNGLGRIFEKAGIAAACLWVKTQLGG